jgi:hypothetical protein
MMLTIDPESVEQTLRYTDHAVPHRDAIGRGPNQRGGWRWLCHWYRAEQRARSSSFARAPLSQPPPGASQTRS